MKNQNVGILILILSLLTPGRTVDAGVALTPNKQVAAEELAVIRQGCSGYGGPYPCYESLSAWKADYGGIDFGLHADGDLIGADVIAVARIEGTWTAADTQPLSLQGWTTDAAHYIRIYTTAEARHAGKRLPACDDGRAPHLHHESQRRTALLGRWDEFHECFLSKF